jgi:hypothetical protein
MTRSRIILATATFVLTACTAIIGVRDISYDANAEGGPGGGDDGSTPPPTPPGSDGGDGGNCVADTQNDGKNCGRCGHDCVGGKCNAGVCAPVVIAPALGRPNAIALDATNAYVTTYADGKVYKVPKDGSLQPVALVPGQSYSQGIVIDGTTLFWANNDYIVDGGAGQVGGVWKCALPACTTPVLVAANDQPHYPTVVGGQVYFSSVGDDSISVALPDAGARKLTTTGRPYGLSVDATHAYFTNSTNFFLRTLINGDGGTEQVGPLNGFAWGLTAIDNDRVYWAFWDDPPGFGGHVLSAQKSNLAAAPITYSTSADKGSLAVTVDDTYVYWANEGTFTSDMNPVSNRDGEIRACPKAGCPPSGSIVLAKGLLDPGFVITDDKAVYYTEFGDTAANGSLQKVAKP